MTTYYVRVDGSNANTGTADTAAGAWLTIDYAVGATSGVTAGDTIKVGPGTYNEIVSVAVSGSAGNYITLIANGGTPLISGTGLEAGFMWGLVSIYDYDYWIIDGFEIANAHE